MAELTQSPVQKSLSIGRLSRLASHVLPYVPPALGYRLCEQLEFLAPHLPVWEQILLNLAHVLPHKTEAVRRRYALEVISNLGKNYYELLLSHALSAEELDPTVDIQGLETV